jgi:hypothetical protein
MKSSKPSGSKFPAILTSLGNLLGKHWKGVAIVSGPIGFFITLLSEFFGVKLTPYGNAFLNLVTDNSFIAFLLVVVIITQIMLYQRVDWIIKQIESPRKGADGGIEENLEAENDKLQTDGGMPPRDSKGRFTSKSSGGSNVLLIVMAAIAGYLFGGESGAIEPLGAALIFVAIVALLQSRE